MSKVTKQITAIAAGHDAATRVAAAALMPKTIKQLMTQIKVTTSQIKKLKQQVKKAKGREAYDIKREIRQRTRELAAALSTIKQKKAIAKQGVPSGVVTLSPEKAKAQLISVQAAKEKSIAALKARQTLDKPTDFKLLSAVDNQVKLIKAQVSHQTQREKLLAKGLDFVQDPKISASVVKTPRIRIDLPPAYIAPKPVNVIVLFRLLAATVPRNPGENTVAYRHRLRAYTKRALLRAINLETKELRPSAQAIEIAAMETVKEDGPAIEEEAKLGGYVSDPTADPMTVFIDPIADQLDDAIIDLQPVVPNEPITPEVTNSLLTASDGLIDRGYYYPKTTEQEDPIDEVTNALLAAPKKSDTPLYKKPIFWAAALGLGAAILVIRG